MEERSVVGIDIENIGLSCFLKKLVALLPSYALSS